MAVRAEHDPAFPEMLSDVAHGVVRKRRGFLQGAEGGLAQVIGSDGGWRDHMAKKTQGFLRLFCVRVQGQPDVDIDDEDRPSSRTGYGTTL